MSEDIMLHTDRRGDEFWLAPVVEEDSDDEMEDYLWLENRAYEYGE